MPVVLFDDQIADLRGNLRRLHQSRTGTVLVQSFLENASAALRDEVGKQSKSVRNKIPSFTNIFDLVERYVGSKMSNPAIEGALLCVCHLADFIGYYEQQPEKYLKFNTSCILGVGLGLLSASAVACSRTLVDLPLIATQIVRIAFRTGAIVDRLSQQLFQSEKGIASWSMIVYDGNEAKIQAELDSYHERMRDSESGHIYISTVGSGACTVSGPPSKLENLMHESEFFREAKTEEVPIYGLYHAAHVYGETEVQEILNLDIDSAQGILPPCRLVLSTVNGKKIAASSALHLFEQAVREILIRPIQWKALQQGVVDQADKMESFDGQVLGFTTTSAASSFMSALRSEVKADLTFEDLAGWCSNPEKIQSRGQFVNSKIAIVGMSGRFPGGDGVEGLWKVLEDGVDVHKSIPKDRFNVDTHYDATGKKNNTSHTPYGCFIDEPGLFDPRFFNMSPREATQTDPMHRLALETAYEALEMSGFVPNRTPSTQLDRVGTFYGQTSDDWREVNAAQQIETYFIPGGVRAFAPGRINYYFKFRGPSYSVDTACSSSLAAVQIACTSLGNNECDTAIAGGLNVLTAPDIFAGLSRGQFLSKTGSCKTWDSNADGYCRADAVGSVVMKRLEDAEADNDNILAIILGSATNHSADAISITHPHAENQSFLFESILHTAAVDPSEVSYVEMHGTGTQAGDTTEMRSVTAVFAPENNKRPANRPLHIGAIKANVGHGESAAGITALIKLLLMLQRNSIPPHVGIKTSLNPDFPDLEKLNVRIPFQKVDWLPIDEKPRIAFLNNFSAAGGNTSLVLQDGPKPIRSFQPDPRSVYAILVSAKSMSSLERNIKHLVDYIDQNPNVSLSSLSYTTTARRMHHNYRVAVSVSSLEETKRALLARLEGGKFTPISSSPPKVAFIFTGQGAFYPSLGKQLYQDSSQFRTDITYLDNLIQSLSLPSILPIIKGNVDDAAISSSLTVQLTLVCIQIALAKLWNSWGIMPSVVIGHSLGEYAALNAAGVLSVDDTIHLVGQRAKLLQETCSTGTHAMLAIKTSLSNTEDAANGLSFDIACMNTENDTVISGTVDEINKAKKILGQAGHKSLKLDLPYAFHSTQVDPILDSFEEISASVVFASPKVPVISPLLGKVVYNANEINASYLRRHAREPVKFSDAIHIAQDEGVLDLKTIFIEIGPQPICSGMIKSTLGTANVMVPSLLKSENPWKTLCSSLCLIHCNGLNINWSEIQRDYDASHQLLHLPSYSFDRKNYWIDYVNDWSLTKIEPRISTDQNPKTVLPKSSLSTSTVHNIVQEEFSDTTGKVVMQSNLSDPLLRAAVLGHSVNGTGLCPSSIYADIALTLANYVHNHVKPNQVKVDMDVEQMEVVKPLILKTNSSEPLTLQVTIEADLNIGQASVRYESIVPKAKKPVEHANCIVTYGDASRWLSEWSANNYLIQSRIESLKDAVAQGKAHQISRGLVYKLFAALVDYDEKYQGIDEVTLDSSRFEATSRVSFKTSDKDGKFFCSPYWIDSLAHLSGFILNGSDAVDSKNFVYISHGWKSMRFSQQFSSTANYESYVKMQPAGTNIMSGDIYICENKTIIGVVQGLKFQRIPRAVLNNILPPSDVSSAKAAPTNVSSTKAVPAKSTEITSPQQQKKISPSKATPESKKPLNSDMISRALKIIASETDLALSELQDECSFGDLGIDSLLSLQIAGKFREDLDLNVTSAVFAENPTIGDLRKFLAAQSSGKSSATTTPPSEGQEKADDSESTASNLETPSESDISESSISSTDTTMLIRTTIAKEMGIALDEVSGSNDLLSLGMDSLMSICILGTLREQTKLSLPATLFQDHPSIDAVEEYLNLKPKQTQRPQNKVDVKSSAPKLDNARNSRSFPPAVSVLMQGKPQTATKTLFLFPDGSGSATSYASIPNISPSVCVYGLNCPFMTTPEDYTIGIEGVTALYLAEVRRRQPKGPYYLGGWSAGGVVAFEATQQLLAAGEQVEKLIFFDSPCPIKLEPLPARLHHFFADVGLLGGENPKGPPSWLLPHFDASIKALTAYEPKPIRDPATQPKTLAIWARHGVCRYPDDPRPAPSADADPKSMKWLLENRTDFGSNGWDQLLGAHNIQTTTVDGNHFTMMKEPLIHRLAGLIKKGLQ